MNPSHRREHGVEPAGLTGVLRIDKWLWAARFFKTRGLAQAAIEAGHVWIDDERIKSSRAVRIGERIRVRIGDQERELVVAGLSDQRGPAARAQLLYTETAQSLRRREDQRERKALYAEPAEKWRGRPTKRDRRHLERASSGGLGPTD